MRSGQHAADRCRHSPVGGFELESWSVAAEDGELVAQDEDLEILASVVTGELGESWMERHNVR